MLGAGMLCLFILIIVGYVIYLVDQSQVYPQQSDYTGKKPPEPVLYVPRKADTTYNTGVTKVYTKYVQPLIPVWPVKKPPVAEFFGRLEGKSLIKKGKYEEKYLPSWELTTWKLQKEREELLNQGKIDENPNDDLEPPFVPTKLTY